MTVRKAAAALVVAALALLTGAAQTAARAAPPSDTVPPGGAERPAAREVRLAMAAIRTDPEAALRHARAALALSPPDPRGADDAAVRASALWLAGESYFRLDKPEQATPFLVAASDMAQRAGRDSRLIADIGLSRGRAEAALGQVGPALQDLQTAFHAFQRANKPLGEAVALQEIGVIYFHAREYPRALDYYEQAAQSFPKGSVMHVAAENNRGAALKEMGRLAQSEEAFRAAFADAVRLRNASLEAHVLSNIALTDILQGKPAAAKKALLEGFAVVAESPKASDERPFLNAAAAELASAQGRPAEAARLLDLVFDARTGGELSFGMRDAHALAAEVYDKVGRPRAALEHLRTFKKIDDDGRALAASTEAALIGAKFDFANQKTTIAKLEADNLKRDFALAQARSRFALLMGAALILGGALLIAVMQRALVTARRSRREIEAVNRELATSNHALEKALNAKTEFLAMTSHEIRTPLNGILGMTQVMLAEPSIDEALRSRLEVIRASGVTMNEMLTDLLDIAKIEKGQMRIEKTEFDLPEFLSEISRMWSDKARTKGLAFDLVSENCPDRIVEDRVVLRQILTNLLSNAVKFTTTGEVRLTVSSSFEAENRLVFAVSDTGIGIPEGEFHRVFDAFTQVDGGTSRAYGGTGLGLAICQNLTRALGGAISLSSEVGKGSTFTVDLPLTPASVAPSPPQEEGKGFDKAVVLAFEDNPLAQAMLRLALKDKVRRLNFASGGETSKGDCADAPDLVLVDGGALSRQGADDGFGGVAAVRARFAGAPLVALWPAMTDGDAQRLTALGVDLALSKPVAAPALIEALQDVYSRSLLRDASATSRAA